MTATQTAVSALPRGIRNNNPGNLRPGPSWLGVAGVDTAPPDPPYLRFVDPEHGIRALARTLISYTDHHGINTLAGVFARWAPASDGNDPDGYAVTVARELNWEVAAPIDLHDAAILAALAAAITCEENGHPPGQGTNLSWYSSETYRRGVALALGGVISAATVAAVPVPLSKREG